MPVIAFKRECALSTQPIRAMLRANLPDFKWSFEWRSFRANKGQHVEDMEGIADILRIMGTSEDRIVAMEVEAFWKSLPGDAPDHIWYARVQDAVAEPQLTAQLRYLVCYALTALIDEASCRLDDTGEWLDAAALHREVERALSAPEPAMAARPPVSAPVSAPVPVNSRISNLPAMILLLDHLPESLDSGVISRYLHMLDPDGDWRLRAGVDGRLIVEGRGTAIAITLSPEPCTTVDLALGFTRSFWFNGDRDQVAAHRAHIRVDTGIDTATADWTAIRQTARIATFLATHLAESCATLALYNDALGTLFGPQNCREAFDVLARGKLPISLWTWTVPQSLADGDVSLATLGIEAFLGYEVETWHAPLGPLDAQQQFSSILAYLLEHGPVLRDGDMIGSPTAATGTRCRLGQPGQLPRGRETPALLLDLNVPNALPGTQPIPQAPPAPAPTAIFGFDEDQFDFSAFEDKAA